MLEENYQQKFDYLESEKTHLHSSAKVLTEEKDEMESKQHSKIETRAHGQLYNGNIQQCCFELLSMNVGIHQVDPIIKYVLKNLTEKEIDVLPSVRTLVRMLTELNISAISR